MSLSGTPHLGSGDIQDPTAPPWASIQIVGVLRTPFLCLADVPDQPFASRAEGRVEISPAFEEGLEGLEGFSHVILLYLFHRVGKRILRVHSRIDGITRGIFATREPQRPTAIGVSVVRLVRIKGSTLWVYGVDMLDQSPLIDIKPYVPAYDRRDGACIGWMQGKVPG